MPASSSSPSAPTQPALSVSQLTAQVKGLMEQSFPDVWVAGEVSNFSRPSSGHCYFTLKDEHAQIRAVIWRGSANKMRFNLADGQQLVCHGRIDVYGPRGSYQLVIDQAQPQGMGALELALRQLREKLAAEGLFDKERKQPLPAFPQRIGFVTSPTGAAIRDFLEVAGRRWLGAEILVIPAMVQGAGAAAEIAAGIRLANKIKPPIDALVVGRGGGSIEDLWAFNEEPVVRAIAASRVPTISAVGHEVDVTLADLAADVRAATPTEAAERVVPSAEEVARQMASLGERMHRCIARRVEGYRVRLDGLAARRPFARPFSIVEDAARRVDELEAIATRLVRQQCLEHRRQLQRLAGKLESLSPLDVLSRGYSLAQDRRGRVVRSSKQLTQGDSVMLRFAKGQAEATIDKVT